MIRGVVMLVAALTTAPLAAQRLPERWDGDQWEHVAAGAVVAAAMRGPWITPAWRDTWWKRGAWQLGLSALYELITLQTARGYGGTLPWNDTRLDLTADMAGWALVELGTLLLKEMW